MVCVNKFAFWGDASGAVGGSAMQVIIKMLHHGKLRSLRVL
jgi:hypothetical protein